MTLLRRMKRLLSPLRGTPFHPQWLVLRGHADTQRAVGQIARGKVLDIGCGDRWAERALLPTVRYVGLDYPETVAKGYPGHPDVFGDAHHLPFSDEQFETVVILSVLEHLPNPEIAISEAHRVLKSGGALMVQVPFLYPLHDQPHDFQRWTLYGLCALFDRYHLKVKEITRHGHPMETAAGMFAIALAQCVADAVSSKHPAFLLSPFLLAAIPLVNLFGWLTARLFPDNSMMPFGYRLIGVKIE